mgnify:FL=1
MINFFQNRKHEVYAVGIENELSVSSINKLVWLFGEADILPETIISQKFIGPRKEMITPWSTNAVEITQNMGISGIGRIVTGFKSRA